jgi:NitT/TauT family transport system permease protein
MRRAAPYIIPFIFFCFWYLSGRFGLIPGYLLPSPADIGSAAYHYIFSGDSAGPYAGRFLSDFMSSSARVIGGFAIAAATGIPLGLACGRNRLLNSFVSGPLNAVRAVPGISWLPLAMIWFGIGDTTSIFLIALAGFFPIFLNTFSGAEKMDINLYYAGAMLGVTRVQGVLHILLPACVPYIVPGLRLGLGIAWAYLVLGELTGVPNGLGALIMDARMLGRVDMIIVGMILIALIGRAFDYLLIRILKLCFKSVRRMI